MINLGRFRIKIKTEPHHYWVVLLKSWANRIEYSSKKYENLTKGFDWVLFNIWNLLRKFRFQTFLRPTSTLALTTLSLKDFISFFYELFLIKRKNFNFWANQTSIPISILKFMKNTRLSSFQLTTLIFFIWFEFLFLNEYRIVLRIKATFKPRNLGKFKKNILKFSIF